MTIFVNIDTLINGTIYDKLKKKYHNIQYKVNAYCRTISENDSDSLGQGSEGEEKEKTHSGSNICNSNKRIQVTEGSW